MVLAAVMTLAAWLLLGGNAQAQASGARYEGQGTDFSAVVLTVAADGQTLQFAAAYYAPTVAAGCRASESIAGVPLAAGRASATLVGQSTTQRFTIEAAFQPDGTASGSYAVEPAPGSACPRRAFEWTAVARPAVPTALQPSSAYSGAASIAGANVYLVTNATSGIAGLQGRAPESGACTATMNINGPYPIGADLGYDVAGVRPNESVFGSRVRAYFDGTTVRGAFVKTATDACPAFVGTFAGMRSSGTITSGAVPRAGGFGLVVFGGGTSDQLVGASGCPRETAAFWSTASDGTFVAYVPAATVIEVNRAWSTLFIGGIPPNTPLIGRCAQAG